MKRIGLLLFVVACGTPRVATPVSIPEPLLVVAGETGVHLVGLDGKPRRQLSATPARQPRRWAAANAVIFYTRELGQLRTIDLATGVERVIVTLPDSFGSCAMEEGGDAPVDVRLAELDIQSEGDFVIDETSNAACLRLMDRNENMLGISVEVRVELGAGSVQAAITYPSECQQPGPAECPYPTAPGEGPDDPAQFPFSVNDGWLLRGSERVAEMGDYFEERPPGRSPSGRWMVLGGEISEGDYIHRRLLLLDRELGKLWSLGTEGAAEVVPGPSPAAADGRELPSLGAVGESSLWWVAGQDVLIVDWYLVRPGVATIELGGDVAR
jgi:hypothetical protein